MKINYEISKFRIFAPSYNLIGEFSDKKEITLDSAIRKDAYTFLTPSGCATSPGIFIYFKFLVMSHNKNFEEAYAFLREYFEGNVSTGLCRSIAEIQNTIILTTHTNASHDLFPEVSSSLGDLMFVLEFFEKIEKNDQN